MISIIYKSINFISGLFLQPYLHYALVLTFGSFYLFSISANQDLLLFGLLDPALILISYLLTHFAWCPIIQFARTSSLDVSSQRLSNLASLAMLTLLGSSLYLFSQGAVGDSRLVVFRDNRLVDQLFRISWLLVQLAIWFTPTKRSIYFATLRLFVIALSPMSKGALFSELFSAIQVYYYKWRYHLSDRHKKTCMVLLLSLLGISFLYLFIFSDLYGLSGSSLIWVLMLRTFFPNDIYLDISNLSARTLQQISSHFSPLLIYEPFTRLFLYDETPSSTLGSIFREATLNPYQPTGGTSFFGAQLYLFKDRPLFLFISILFLASIMFLVILLQRLILSKSAKGLMPILFLLYYLPLSYLQEPSGFSMLVFQASIIFILFLLWRR
jgi:hypothetical protein